MPQFDKNGRVVAPAYATGAGNPQTVVNNSAPSNGGAGPAAGGAMTNSYAGMVGYTPGMMTPNAPANSTTATDQARAAIQGLQSATPGGNATGGEGSSYSTDANGRVTSTVTPNLLPQQAQLQQSQTNLEGQIAAEAAKAGAGYTSAQSAQNSTQNQTEAAQREGLGEKAFGSQFSLLQPYLGGGAAGSSPHVDMGGATMNPQEAAARAAAFARAKETAGNTALGAMKGLQGAMENRGMTGSSLEAQGMGGIVGGAAGGVNDFTREQLINDLNRYGAISDETYQGNITQRGQDLQRQQSIIGLLGRGVTY